MVEIPDIPYTIAAQMITNGAGTELSVSVSVQGLHQYYADSPWGHSQECVAVLYQSDPIEVVPGDDRTVGFALAWNLLCPQFYINAQLKILTRAFAQYYLGQDIIGGPRPYPVMWPLTDDALAFVSGAMLRDPLRYLVLVDGDVNNFYDWVPPMYEASAPPPPPPIPS